MPARSDFFPLLCSTVSNFAEDIPEAKEFHEAVVDLDPEKFFSPLCISKGEVLNFEKKMKEQLVRWRDAGLHKEVRITSCLCQSECRSISYFLLLFFSACSD